MTVLLSLHEKVDLLHSRIDQIVEVTQGFEREEYRPLCELVAETDELWDSIRTQVQSSEKPVNLNELTALAMGYGTQTVIDEETEQISLNLSDDKPQSIFHLDHKPMFKGCLSGILSIGSNATYTFIGKSDGEVELREIGNVVHKVEKIVVDYTQGIITVQWGECHGFPVSLKVCYEYNADA